MKHSRDNRFRVSPDITNESFVFTNIVVLKYSIFKRIKLFIGKINQRIKNKVTKGIRKVGNKQRSYYLCNP